MFRRKPSILLSLLGACICQTALAQVPDTSAAIQKYNILKLDLGGPLYHTLDANVMSTAYFTPIFPVLFSYERTVGKRTSLVGEALLGGGRPGDVRWGGGVQGRYYFRAKPGTLQGLYTGATLAYRNVRTDIGYRTWWQAWVGPGAWLGWQQCGRHWGIDVSFGINAWAPVSAAAPQGTLWEPEATAYDRNRVLPDARLGVGYRWGRASRR